MTSQDVKRLRKEGNLEEALNLAQSLVANEPDNIWFIRAIAWVHHDYLKQANSNQDFDSFMSHLTAIGNLDLPRDEKMIFDTCSWQIGKMVYSLVKSQSLDQLGGIFECIKEFPFVRPSESFSFLLKAFAKAGEKWSSFVPFVDWWGLHNLREPDFVKEEFEGRKTMSLAEKVHIAYAKALLSPMQEISISPDGMVQFKTEARDSQDFTRHLGEVIEAHPELTFLPYFHAKLLIQSGTKDSALKTILPFARKKAKEYWVWQVLAEIFEDDDYKAMACNCKALSLGAQDGYLVKLRQSLAETLVDQGKFDEARTEIDILFNTRNQKGWKIPTIVDSWRHSTWYNSANNLGTNEKLYLEKSAIADELLYADVPQEIVVIDNVNAPKKMASFVIAKGQQGFFNYQKTNIKPQPGDLFSFRLERVGNEGYCKVLTAQRASDELIRTHEAVDVFEGQFQKVTGKDFGFVNIDSASGIFVPPNLASGFSEGVQDVKGKAVLTFNKSKREWGWKAVSMKLVSDSL